jgi:penicillin-binding protein 1A
VRLRASAARAQVEQLLKSRWSKALGGAISIGLAAVAALLIGGYIWLFSGLPRVPDVNALWTMDRQPGITFVNEKGETLAVRGPYYGRAVTLRDMPLYVAHAFLAIEDRRFYEHRGVDRAAILRALAVNVSAGRTVQGGSTITQQLVKNLFLSPRQDAQRKLQEMILAGRIERLLTKDQILELYMNRVYLGDQAFGVDAASRRFFGKPASQLTLPEAAMLAGLPKAPSRSAPTENMERAKERQLLVLNAMVEAGYITAEQRDGYAAEEIKVASAIPPEGDLGYALDLAAEEARKLVGDAAPDLIVQITINPELQAEAQRVVLEGVKHSSPRNKPLQASLVAVDLKGAVRALVGGTSYDKTKFNRAVQGRRQPGSTFKTFVYAAAFEDGLTPEDVRYDEPVNIDGWRPENYSEGFQGAVTLRTAFAQSLNTVAAQVGHEVGPRNVADLATRFGLNTMPKQGQPVPDSIALGSVEVTLFDMVQAFSVFMREGGRIDSYLVSAVTDSRGNALYTRPSVVPERVYDLKYAHMMNNLLGRVVQNGTGARAQLTKRDSAGKTGTSQDWRDAWFIGYTTEMTAGVWMGNDDDTPMPRIAGSGPPAEMWAQFMTFAHKNIPVNKIPGITPPERTVRQVEAAAFYDDLGAAFGEDRPPPDEGF